MKDRTIVEALFNAVMCCVVLAVLLLVDGPQSVGRQIDALMEDTP